jgi:hypothetical protein
MYFPIYTEVAELVDELRIQRHIRNARKEAERVEAMRREARRANAVAISQYHHKKFLELTRQRDVARWAWLIADEEHENELRDAYLAAIDAMYDQFIEGADAVIDKLASLNSEIVA